MRRLCPLILLGAVGCGAGGDCDPASIAERLAGARAGDTVEIGACVTEGNFVVPNGVTVRGAGVGETFVNVTSDLGFRFTGDGAIEGLTIDSVGSAAIFAIGPSSLRIEDVTVNAGRGIGVGVENLAALTMRNVTLRGPANADNAELYPVETGSNVAATHGLVLVRVAQANLQSISVQGFVVAGALLLDSTTSWTGGDADLNLYSGIHQDGGSLDLSGVSASGTFEGTSAEPAKGLVLTSAAAVTTSQLRAEDGEGFGVLHLEQSTGTHTNLAINRNERAGLWCQGADALEVAGNADENGAAGMVVIDCANVNLHDLQVGRSRSRLETVGPTETATISDGIQLQGSTLGLRLTNVRLTDNARVGLLLHLNGEMIGAGVITNVNVMGPSGANGAVAQTGTVAANWDSGITRDSNTLANDNALANPLDIVGAVTPCDHPTADRARLSGVGGLLP